MVAEPPPFPGASPLPPPPPDRGRDPAAWGRVAIGGMVVVKACITIGAALLEAAAGVFILGLFRKVAAEQEIALGPALQFVLANPWILVIPALGAVACGVWLIVTPAYRWTMLILSTLLLLGPIAILLWAMIGVIGPLYQVR